jgi:transposase
MLTLPSSVKIFIYTQPTDMRCGFNKLSMFAESVMCKDPFSGHLFVFFDKFGDKCKILFWDRTGFCIWYKRLEKVSTHPANKIDELLPSNWKKPNSGTKDDGVVKDQIVQVA